MDRARLLMCSQDSETGLFSKLEESSPHTFFLIFRIHFIIIHTSTLISSNRFLSFRLLTKTLCAFLLSPLLATGHFVVFGHKESL